MTDKEKLQQLFAAALKDSATPSGHAPTRAFPASKLNAVPVPMAAPVPQPIPATPSLPTAPLPVIAVAALAAEPVETTRPTMAAVLDDAASAELAALLDEQQKRKSRRHRMEALGTALVLFSLTGGGFLWFVQSPQRMQAFNEAVHDIRSVGDVKGLVGKYQNALERVSARSRQIDQATASMGVKASAGHENDAHMDAEMKAMMGGEGKTPGERNRALQKNFGDKVKAPSDNAKTTVALKQDQSFDLQK